MIFLLLFTISIDVHYVIGQCQKSLTTVNGEVICKGEQIFYDNFDSINRNIWRHEEIIPGAPDYDFCFFDKSPDVSYIDVGSLVIKPKILDNDFVRGGKLIMANCTGQLPQECTREGKSFQIIPPVKSARLSTINSFSFKYGKIDISAKLPGGDWIVPELRLLPKEEEYGPYYESGVISIASSRGNRYLQSKNNKEIGSSVLRSGFYLSSGGENYKVRSRISNLMSQSPWHFDSHTYSILWTPDGLQVFVDGKEVADLIPHQYSGTLPSLMGFSSNETKKWKNPSKMAPFNREFYISVGVSVGGVREFRDDITNGGARKPWKNLSPKNLLSFWQAVSSWSRTWSDSNTRMEIHRITVTAL